jgi:hypothetical protein
MKLHNFCINNDSASTPSTLEADERAINKAAIYHRKKNATPKVAVQGLRRPTVNKYGKNRA